MNQLLGKIELSDTLTSGADLRIAKYDVIDYLNQVTNKMLVVMPGGEERDSILQDLKRAKELVNNL